MSEQDVSEFVIAGGGALIKKLPEIFTERIGKQVEVIDPFKNISISKKLDEDYIRDLAPLGAVAIGLALRRVGDR